MKQNLKNQLLSNIDIIVDIISKGNTVEVKKNKNGHYRQWCIQQRTGSLYASEPAKYQQRRYA